MNETTRKISKEEMRIWREAFDRAYCHPARKTKEALRKQPSQESV